MPSEPRYGKLRQQKTDGKYAVRFYFYPDLWGKFSDIYSIASSAYFPKS